MPYRLECQIGGWGAVRNPLDEDETISVEDDEIVVDDNDLATALADDYSALELVEEPDVEHDEGFDAESFLDRTPMTAVIEDIESGMVDAYLGQLVEQADRKGVQNAIEERQVEHD